MKILRVYVNESLIIFLRTYKGGRWMNIHEYQAKNIMKKYNIPVPNGVHALTVEDALKAAKSMESAVVAVKAQIHAGGRGKAGGVKIAKSLEEVESAAKNILGATLVTPQTGPEGKVVNQLLIEQGLDIEKEYYLSFIVDRSTSGVVIIGSAEGGMDIEEVAEHSPEKVFKEVIDTSVGLQEFQVRRLLFNIGIPKEAFKEASMLVINMYKLFMDNDCNIVEINPLVLTGDKRIIALDAKISFDSNSLYRHKDLLELRDLTEEDPREIEASKHDLSYISLTGNIGCMVNGAGLAMATMDMIDYYGGSPANFLDVGGGATKEKVTEAFKILLSDSNVKGILVNIFGGIMKCDIIAEGVVAAAKELDLKVPLVVRLEGTNVELGKKILSESGLDLIAASSLAEGASKIVKLVNDKAVM